MLRVWRQAPGWQRFHLVAMTVWGPGVVPITLMFPKSVLWVALMSQYANFVGHFAAYMGSRAEQAAS